MNIQDRIELVAPTILTIMMVLISINLLIYLTYLKSSPSKITKQMTMYWFVQLLSFLLIPLVGEGNLQMAVPFSLNMLTCYIIYEACFGSIKKVINFKIFFVVFAVSWPVAIVNELLFANFTITTMPIAVAESLPAFYMLRLVVSRKTPEFKTIHHKWLFIVVGLATIHIFNFSLFRQDPEHFVWGMTVHLMLIAAFSVILSNFHTYLIERSEKIRLSSLVEVRTMELNEKLKQLQILSEEKAHLFRILLHDISNPMTTVINSLSILTKEKLSEEKKGLFTVNAYKSAESIISIIGQVRTLEAMKTGKINLVGEMVNLREAFELAVTIFGQQYEQKGVRLLVDYPHQDILIQGNREIFVHSVLCNLLSNSLKFSQPGTQVHLGFHIEEQRLIVTVQDQGLGMKQEQIARLFDMDKPTSQAGTMGEVGTGFGMPLIKNYLEQVDGKIRIRSKTLDENQAEHGTQVELMFGLVQPVPSEPKPMVQ